ncbi:MAG: glycosyltransferase [Frankiales bacterium]|nr:glycosyltransferase [Frankiales bacterium]
MTRPLEVQLLVIAKEPRPGRAKTRLSPALGPEQAAAVALAALTDTLTAVHRTPARRRVLVLDGTPGAWVPAGWDVLPQREGGLADRLTGAFADAAAGCDLPMLLIGMDTPQVTPALLTAAVTDLLATDAVLGRALDGGWWALGLHAPHPHAFAGVPMSTGTTGAAQAARLGELGLRTTELPVLRDIDLPADLRAVLDELPADSALARLMAVVA